jgi:hypothetical protein
VIAGGPHHAVDGLRRTTTTGRYGVDFCCRVVVVPGTTLVPIKCVCGDESISLGISLNNDLCVCRGNEHANYVPEQPKKGILGFLQTDMLLFVRSPLVYCKNVDPRIIAPQQMWPFVKLFLLIKKRVDEIVSRNEELASVYDTRLFAMSVSELTPEGHPVNPTWPWY